MVQLVIPRQMYAMSYAVFDIATGVHVAYCDVTLHSLHTSARIRTQLRSLRSHTTFVPRVNINLSRISS